MERHHDDPESSLDELSRDECLRLLAGRSVGRVATCLPGRSPLVVPVNYVLHGDVVVFRTAPGTKLRELREQPVSFQLDEIDPLHHTGWSVLVQGVAYEALPAEVSGLELEPWASGERHHWVRILPALVTGRRITSMLAPTDERGYR